MAPLVARRPECEDVALEAHRGGPGLCVSSRDEPRSILREREKKTTDTHFETNQGDWGGYSVCRRDARQKARPARRLEAVVPLELVAKWHARIAVGLIAVGLTAVGLTAVRRKERHHLDGNLDLVREPNTHRAVEYAQTAERLDHCTRARIVEAVDEKRRLVDPRDHRGLLEPARRLGDSPGTKDLRVIER